MNKIIKLVNGKEEVFGNNITQHNELAGRDAYGCHTIQSIRKLPEKLANLSARNEDLENKLNTMNGNIEHLHIDVPTKQDIDEIKLDLATVKEGAQKISLSEKDGELTFIDYNGNSETFRSGNEVDNDSIQIVNDKLAIKKIYSDESLNGEGTQESPLSVNIDDKSIKLINEKLSACGLCEVSTGNTYTAEQIRDYIVSVDNQLTEVDIELQNQINDINQVNEQQKLDLRNINARVKGIGGYLTANNFGVAKPNPADLNDYAYEQIFGTTKGHNEAEIYDQTKVKNTFDGHIWVFNHYISDGAIAYEWVDNGTEYINTADNNGVQGIVTGSYEPWQGAIDVLGHISINGLEEFVTSTNNTLADLANNQSGVMITITAPENAVQGTLTSEQLNTLKSSENSYIKFNDELFFLQDNRIEKGYMIYSHLSHENTQTYYVKCIAITIGELEQAAWALTTLALPSPVQPLMASDFLLDEHNGGEIQSLHYNPNSECVELGTCTQDNDTGELIYTDSNPIATRDDNHAFTDGNLVKWDATNNRFVDSGVSAPNSNSSTIQRNVYDEATLEEHLEEIFGHVNVENGGSLMSIGFKVGSDVALTTPVKIIKFSSSTSVSDGTARPFTAGDFIQASVEHIDADKSNIYLRCGVNPYSNAIIALQRRGIEGAYTYTATISSNQLSTNPTDGSPILTYYNDVDITTMILEHLTITYHS